MSEAAREWQVAKVSVRDLICFNILLIVYNALFVIYSSLSLHMQDYNYLIICLPILNSLIFLISVNFTRRYYHLAQVMYNFFNSDVEK